MNVAAVHSRQRPRTKRKRSRKDDARSDTLSCWLNAHWELVTFSLVSLAAILRVFDLSARPLHHDEGVNGFFMVSLFRDGLYRYNPTNYHGPFVYYCALLTSTITSFFFGKEGLSTWSIRIVPALFGTAIVWLTLGLRRQLGIFGTFSATLLLVVSPGEVFFSRYFIHEILFVCLALAVVVTGIRFQETHESRYVTWIAVWLAFLCATKETWVITVAVLSVALFLSTVIPVRQNSHGLARNSGSDKARRPELKRPFLRTPEDRELIVRAVVVLCGIWVLLYSSFLANFPQGVYDSFATFNAWAKTASDAYVSPWFTYLKWLFQEESPSLILGAIGVAMVLWRRDNRTRSFLAFWVLGMAIAYSLVPYKTPWLSLNISLPLALLAGFCLNQFREFGLRQRSTLLQILAAIVLAAAVALSGYQAVDLSLYRYDDDSIAYSYAHTRKDFFGLLNDIQRAETDNQLGRVAGITVMSPEHWPLFWYLRDNPNVAYEGKIVETNEPFVIAVDSQTSEVEQRFGERYHRRSAHDLRPGNRLVLYLRRDLK
jgi:uncharacterized protein (TIGR03663 family)